jgi:hypothetical protein
MDSNKSTTSNSCNETVESTNKVSVVISVRIDVLDVEDGTNVFHIIKDALIENGIYSNQMSINMQESQ